jgi:predicted phage tail protein
MWVLTIIGTLLLLVTVRGLFSSVYSVATVPMLFTSGVGMIATGIAESLPARYHTDTVILRVITLSLGVAAVPALVLALINP